MNQYSNLFKIRKEKVSVWKDWCEKLAGMHLEEAKKSLFREKVHTEIFYAFQVGEDYYTLGILLHHKPLSNDTSSDSELDKTHRQKIRECLIPYSVPEKLYHIFHSEVAKEI